MTSTGTQITLILVQVNGVGFLASTNFRLSGGGGLSLVSHMSKRVMSQNDLFDQGIYNSGSRTILLGLFLSPLFYDNHPTQLAIKQRIVPYTPS